LKLEAVSSDSDSLTCSIEEFDLKSCPPFRALSYTWGQAYKVPGQKDEDYAPLEFPASVICNGYRLSVKENLFDALAQLSRMSEVDFLWIDALCINQNNLDEREAQVLLMGDIYSTAEEVVI
jgi:hypothetical protein